MAEAISDILDGKLPFNIMTDLGSAQEWHRVCRQACEKVTVLDEIFSMIEAREIPAQGNKKIRVTDDEISLQHAELFFYLVAKTKPILSVEAGFGAGLAAALITAAHLYNGLKGGHVPIQDAAREVLQGIGLYTMERLDLTGYQLMEHETALVLPQMYLQQLNEGLAFIYLNSATEFDEQMMEYFYINQLLNEGGIIAVNTTHQARSDLIDYILKSRHDYAVRKIDDVITLIQVPPVSALARHQPGHRH